MPPPAAGPERPCPVCGGMRFRPVFDDPDESGLVHRDVRCRECGLVYENPIAAADARPEESLDGWHESEYLIFRRWRPLHQGLGAVLERFGPAARGLRLLDYGCGHGVFLDMARALGIAGTGIEADPSRAAFARDVLKLDCVLAGEVPPDWAPASFGAATAWEVLEHLPDPAPIVRGIARALAPGGLFLASVPNGPVALAKSRVLRAARLRRREFMSPGRHFSHFSARTVRRLLERNGFRVLRVENTRMEETPGLRGAKLAWSRVARRAHAWTGWNLDRGLFVTAERADDA